MAKLITKETLKKWSAIDGKKLKPGVMYRLDDKGNFVEAEGKTDA